MCLGLEKFDLMISNQKAVNMTIMNNRKYNYYAVYIHTLYYYISVIIILNILLRNITYLIVIYLVMLNKLYVCSVLNI